MYNNNYFNSDERSGNSSYSLQENMKCGSSSISVLLQTQHVLWSAGIGEGIAYRPVSILKACALALNPLTTEFFPPRQHIFMHSAHTTFVGTPLPQHSLLSGQTWWGPHTWRDPSGNTVNDIHDPPQGQQSEVKGGCQPDFRPAFP